MPNPRLIARTIIAALFATACADSTGPDDAIRVELSALAGATTEYTIIDETPVIVCEIPIRATVTGNGQGSWTGAMFRFYSGPDRTTPVDSVLATREEIASAFGETGPYGAGAQELDITVSYWLPFEIEFEVRYAVEGRVRRATVRHDCGPPLPASVSAPVITTLQLYGGQPDLHFGDSVVVGVEATSGYGLWETVVRLTGPFTAEHRFAESARTSTIRGWSFVVPDSAVLEVPVTIAAYVVDGVGNVVHRQLLTTRALRDAAPPVLTGASFARVDGVGDTLPSDGQLSRYDRIGINLHATDDLGLAWAIVEVDAPIPVRDSVAIAPPPNNRPAIIQVQASWSGARSIAVRVVDRAGKPSAARVVTPLDSIRIFPFVTRPVARVDLPRSIGDATFDPVHRRFYFSEEYSGNLHVVDAATMTRLPSIAVGPGTRTIEVSATGDSLFLTRRDVPHLEIVDLRPATPTVSAWPLMVAPEGAGAAQVASPRVVRRDAEGRLVIAAMLGSPGTAALLVVDLAANTVRIVDDGTSPAIGALHARLVSSPDRSRIWALHGDCSRVYLTSAATVGPCRPIYPLGWAESHPAVAPDGSEISIADEFFDAELIPIDRAPVAFGGYVRHITWTPTNDAFLAAQDWLYDRVRTSDRVRVDRMGLPVRASQTWHDEGGDFLYVYDYERIALIRVDLR